MNDKIYVPHAEEREQTARIAKENNVHREQLSTERAAREKAEVGRNIWGNKADELRLKLERAERERDEARCCKPDRCAKLEQSLLAANANHEKFERLWYLAQDRCETLEKALKKAAANFRGYVLSLRLDFTEAERYRYCEALVDILRPRCDFGIVSTWDAMNATAEEQAEAYLKVKLNEEKSE